MMGWTGPLVSGLMGAVSIFYPTQGLKLPDLKGESLLEVCLKHQIPVNHVCQGGASCGTCRVLIVSGLHNLPDRNPLEREMAQGRNFSKEERLSCQLQNHEGPFSFVLPKEKKS